MPDLADGESVEIKGSARLPYVLKNTGGVYSCTCPAWCNQSVPIERRNCVRFGKIGTAGQTQTKSFDDNAAAQKHAAKLISEKTKKGYVETTG